MAYNSDEDPVVHDKYTIYILVIEIVGDFLRIKFILNKTLFVLTFRSPL